MRNRVEMLVDMEDGCAKLDLKGRPNNCLCERYSAQKPPEPWLDVLTSRVEVSAAIYNLECGLFLILG